MSPESGFQQGPGGDSESKESLRNDGRRLANSPHQSDQLRQRALSESQGDISSRTGDIRILGLYFWRILPPPLLACRLTYEDTTMAIMTRVYSDCI